MNKGDFNEIQFHLGFPNNKTKSDLIMTKSDLLDAIVQGEVSLASTFFIRGFVVDEHEPSGRRRTKFDLDQEFLKSKLKRLKIDNNASFDIRMLSQINYRNGIVIENIPVKFPTNDLRRLIEKSGLFLTNDCYHYKHIESAVIYIEKSDNKAEVLKKLRHLQYNNESFILHNNHWNK